MNDCSLPSPSPPRVLLIGTRCSADSMESHVLDALRACGCTVTFFSMQPQVGGLGSVAGAVMHKLLDTVSREPERLRENALLRRCAEFAPTLVLVIQGNQLSPKTVDRLRRITAAPIVCWCQDQMVALGRQYLLGAEYDAVFLKDRYLLGLFSSMVRSTTFHYLPEACNPAVHRPLALSEADQLAYGCEVVIFGTLYYYRQELLRSLEDFDLRVWGSVPGWLSVRLKRPPMRRNVLLDEKVRAVRAARIAINPLHYGEVDGLNCRAFELAGCGAFQLITDRPVLREHFTPGEELDCFASINELAEKIRFYLNKPELTASIGERASRRAHAEHSYEQRMRRLLRVALPAPADLSAATFCAEVR